MRRCVLAVARVVATSSSLVTASCFHSFGDSTLSSPGDSGAQDVTADETLGDDQGRLMPNDGDDRGEEVSDGDSGEEGRALSDVENVDVQAPLLPQCMGDAGPAWRTVFSDGFETYPVGSPYGAPGSRWIQAYAGRDAQVTTEWPHTGVHDLMISSFTTKSEVPYVSLALKGPPRAIRLELWCTPDGYYVYEDFAEFGLAYAASTYDLRPTTALKMHNHSLFAVQDPSVPSTDGGAPAPALELYNSIAFGSSFSGPLVATYVRVEFDFCSNSLIAFVGTDSNAPIRGTSQFHAERNVNAFFLGAGLNPSYIDDILITVDDGP